MRCLIVEDDADFGQVLEDCLDDLGHDHDLATSNAQAVEFLNFKKYDLAILDYHLPDGDSADLSHRIAIFCPDVRIILLTGSDIFARGENSKYAPGIDWVLRKPVNLDDLAALVAYANDEHLRQPMAMGSV